MLIGGGADGGWAGWSVTTKAPGARYDATAGTWSAMSSTGAPSARALAGAVWATTTNQMIVWGGCKTLDAFNACLTFAADGAAYDPAKDTWTALPAAPVGFEARANHSMVWTARDAVIFPAPPSPAPVAHRPTYNPRT